MKGNVSKNVIAFAFDGNTAQNKPTNYMIEEHTSRERYRADQIPFSPYAQKQQLLKGKKILFNGVTLPQHVKCLILTNRSHEEIQIIANGRDLNYTTKDKPGWYNGELVNIHEYERYLNNNAYISINQ